MNSRWISSLFFPCLKSKKDKQHTLLGQNIGANIMLKKLVHNLLRLTGLITLIVWGSGFFGLDGSLYILLVMGLIIVFFVLIFVGFIVDND